MFATLALLSILGHPADDPKPALPKPNETPSVTKFPKVIGWPKGKMPTAPPGFRVSVFADGLDNPRWLYVLPNGDVLVAETRTPDKGKTGANRITLLRVTNKNARRG